jgi:hypothetical protein
LFGYIQYATLKNINFNNASVKAFAVAGTLMGHGHSGVEVSECHVTGTVQVESFYKSGGLAGSSYGTYTNCSVIATENSNSYVKATFLGYGGDTVTFKNGDTNVTLTLNDDYEGDNVGGLIGFMGEQNSNKDTTLDYTYNYMYTNCTVKNLSVEGTRKVGGMFGIIYDHCAATGVLVENVTVKTNADTDYLAKKFTDIQVGGIAGTYFTDAAILSSEIKNSTVYGLIADQTGAVCGGPRNSGSSLTSTNVKETNVTIDYIIKNATKTNTTDTVLCTYDYIEVDSARGLLLANKLYTIALNNKGKANIFSAGINYGSKDYLLLLS